MDSLRKLVGSVVTQLYLCALMCCGLLAVAGFFLFDTLFGALAGWIAASVALLAGCVFTSIFIPKKSLAVQLLHQWVDGIEYSLNLLDKETINTAERLQLERVSELADGFQFPYRRIYRTIWPYAVVLLLVLAFRLIWPMIRRVSSDAVSDHTVRQVMPGEQKALPVYLSAEVTIRPPKYSRLPEISVADLNINVLIGSRLHWRVRFANDAGLRLVMTNEKGQQMPFRKTGEGFEYSDDLTGSGLYAIRGYWQDSVVYQSDFYRLSAVADQAPVIEPRSKELYTYHHLGDDPFLKVAARMADDFLVRRAFIVATIARGSGENVKFREVRIPLAQADFQEADLARAIDLSALDFAPGDELYYYWAAIDNREPTANFSRSDTYFVAYKDTAAVEEAELATMAANIMPEYFRSQRQIIIDTEKLIAKRRKMAVKPFQSASNEIGFDQKALRLRYGQYLGEEFETTIGGSAPVDLHDDHNGKEILNAFSHKSDAEGEQAEHRAAEPAHHDHAHASPATEQDPLAALMEQYVHSHDDAETNTFYEESTRALLKSALEQMWQSELHLRMYEPEKALPYEHKALEFLKSAQHKARTFAKKSGYDPPPIKEKEKRLTGELKEISTQLKSSRSYQGLRADQVAAALMVLLENPWPKTRRQQEFATLTGRLLTMMEHREAYHLQPDWVMMGSLSKLSAGGVLTSDELTSLRSSLLNLAKPKVTSRKNAQNGTELGRAFWRNMK